MNAWSFRPVLNARCFPSRRPLRLAFLAAQFRELVRRFVGGNVGDPQMILRPHPNRGLSVGRKLDVLAIFFRAAHIAQQARLARFHVGGPHLLLGFFRFRSGIGNMAFAVQLRPARIDHGLAVGRKLDGKNILAIVTLIMRNLPPGEVRRVRHPDVALARLSNTQAMRFAFAAEVSAVGNGELITCSRVKLDLAELGLLGLELAFCAMEEDAKNRISRESRRSFIRPT